MGRRGKLRLAGLAALLAGVMLAAANLVSFLDLASPDLFGDSNGLLGLVVLSGRSLAMTLGELLLALGLVGLYVRQSEHAGIVGLAGFVFAFLGDELLRGNYLAVLFADLGWALFGVASLRARVYPRAAAALLIVGALVRELFNPTVYVGPGADSGYVGAGAAVVLSVAIAWMGFVLLREGSEVEEDRPPARRSSPDLLRLGGLAVVVGAVLVVLFDLAQLVDLSRPDPGASPDGFEETLTITMYAQQLSAVLGEALVGLGLVALYARQSRDTPWASRRSAQVLTLIGFLTAFGGTFFALDVEDVNWGAVLFADLGWVLFGAVSLRVRVYPRLAAALLIVTALLRGVFNPLVVYSVIGRSAASYALYEGPGAYPIVYASMGIDIIFHLLVAWLGLALLFGTSTRRRQRTASAGGTARYRTSPRLSLLSVGVLLAGLLPIALVTGVFPGENPPGLVQAQATTETNPACPPADQATYGAYSSSRLVVHNSCQHVVGTVHRVEGGETDGDEDIYVIADPQYASLTGAPQNVSDLRRFSYGGNLMMELMPRDGRSVDPATGGTRPPTSPRLARVKRWTCGERGSSTPSTATTRYTPSSPCPPLPTAGKPGERLTRADRSTAALPVMRRPRPRTPNAATRTGIVA